MPDSRIPALFNGSKLSPSLKFLAIIAAAVGSAFGTTQLAPNNQAADTARAHAVRADEKVDLAYQLLGQKVDYENQALNKRVDDLEKRLRRIERKLDRGLALGEARPAGRSGFGLGGVGGALDGVGEGAEEPAAPEPAPVAAPRPEPREQRVALPSSLDAAYASKKAGYGTGL